MNAPIEQRTGEAPSLGQLFGDLSAEIAVLMRKESQLAGEELSQKARRAAGRATFLLAGLIFAVIGLGALAATFVLALAAVVVPWAAGGLVALGFAVVAVALGAFGIASLRTIDPKPERTIVSIKELRSWAEHQV
jgi:hypothetical protein